VARLELGDYRLEGKRARLRIVEKGGKEKLVWLKQRGIGSVQCHGGNQTRQLVLDLGMIPVVPPKSNRLHPWDYDRALYKKRNEIERLFRRLKGFRRIFSRFEKLDVVFLAFLSFARLCV
jgi:hypothetical protein